MNTITLTVFQVLVRLTDERVSKTGRGRAMISRHQLIKEVKNELAGYPNVYTTVNKVVDLYMDKKYIRGFAGEAQHEPDKEYLWIAPTKLGRAQYEQFLQEQMKQRPVRSGAYGFAQWMYVTQGVVERDMTPKMKEDHWPAYLAYREAQGQGTYPRSAHDNSVDGIQITLELD